jgi:CheY-like chemotaxis protein
MLRRLIGEDIRLITSYAEPLGKVQADTGQIQQIVMNLVVNARDAMHNGGTLTIKTANVTFDEEYSRIHSDVEPGDYVMFSVEDTGQGMDPETQSRVFDPFFTTKEMGVGTGLGLSTVYGIVKQHKGHIVVRSELNHGTRFNVYFQKAQDDETMKMPEQVVRSSLQTEGDETILVVEDEEIVRKLICEVLETLHYSTIQAGAPEEALALVQEHEGPIDLLLTDVVLPQMDGRSLFEKILNMRPNIKVLFISGYAENSIVRHGVLDPEVPFLQKPFSADSLAIKVREVLDTLHKRL